MKKQPPKKGATKRDVLSLLSTNARIRAEIPKIMKNRDEILMNTLRDLLEARLGMKLRVDYLVGNMMGMKGYLIDCEDYLIFKITK